jgi:hypothetical protein
MAAFGKKLSAETRQLAYSRDGSTPGLFHSRVGLNFRSRDLLAISGSTPHP